MSKARGPYRVDPLGYKKANEALDKMAENARELGLDYELQDKDPDLIEQPAQQQEPTATELSNGLGLALHDAVLIRIGGSDEATKQACARIDKLVEKYRAEHPDTQPAQQQEPAALGYMNAGHVHEMQQGRLPYGYVYPKGGSGADVALYTSSPAQRTWVGLTDEEIQTIWRSSEHMNEAEVCRAIESKLKEKNA